MTTLPADMNKPAEPSSALLVGTLAVAGLASGLAIVGVYEVTLPIIEANNARALERAVFKVVPGSELMQGLVIEDGVVRVAGPDEAAVVYAAYDAGGVFAGYAIPGEGAGFQDVIKLLYGYDPGLKQIVGMEILESRETPGLGDKIYKDMDFVGCFSALAVEPAVVCVKAGEKVNDNEVDAITGATISSKAVVRIIGEANERWLGVLPGVDGVPVMVVEEEDGGEGEPPPTPLRGATSPVGDGGGEVGDDGHDAHPTEGNDGLEAHPTGETDGGHG